MTTEFDTSVIVGLAILVGYMAAHIHHWRKDK
jgi:hypothetical protein